MMLDPGALGANPKQTIQLILPSQPRPHNLSEGIEVKYEKH